MCTLKVHSTLKKKHQVQSSACCGWSTTEQQAFTTTFLSAHMVSSPLKTSGQSSRIHLQGSGNWRCVSYQGSSPLHASSSERRAELHAPKLGAVARLRLATFVQAVPLVPPLVVKMMKQHSRSVRKNAKSHKNAILFNDVVLFRLVRLWKRVVFPPESNRPPWSQAPPSAASHTRSFSDPKTYEVSIHGDRSAAVTCVDTCAVLASGWLLTMTCQISDVIQNWPTRNQLT